MKAIDWLNMLQEQRDKYGKTVFTVTELANLSGHKAESLNVSLSRLVNRGIIQNYTKGRYGIAGAAGIDALVASLDAAAYITGMYILYRHQLVTQVPAEVTCFTNHRHNRSRVRATPLGRLVFVCVSKSIYSRPENDGSASPEQALCDYVHLCRKRGVAAQDIVTFRNLHRLDRDLLQDRLKNYPSTVKREIDNLIQ